MSKIEVDYERVALLFQVVELQSKLGPAYTALGQEAMAELREVNQAIVDANKPDPKETRSNLDEPYPTEEPKSVKPPLFPKESGVDVTPVEKRI